MPKINKEIEKMHPKIRDMYELSNLLNDESSRGSVLVSCSYLDEQLRKIIESFLIKNTEKSILLEGFNAPIGTFSARIKLAHCLGLISNRERDDCNTLRKVRNEFAHNHQASFEDQKIIDLCNNLYHSVQDDDFEASAQFTTGAVGLITSLLNRAYYVSQEQLKRKKWKK